VKFNTKDIRRACAAILGLAGILALQPAWSADDQLLARIKAAGVIRIANTQSTPPWTFLNDANQPAGYDIDMSYEVARRMGIPKVQFVADSFKNFVEGLKADKYDLVMNDLTPTVERAKQVDFSSPYGVEDFRIFVRQDNTDIHSQADLAGKRVGVTTGSSNESWSRAHLTKSEIKTYDNGGLVFADLGNRRIDAVIISHFGGLKYANVNRLPIKEVGEPLTYQLSAAAMVKGQPSLRASVNKAIAEMMADGTIERIGKKWVGEQYDMVGTIGRAQQELQESAK
jgi:cystine transport system substrate-binding protein